MPGMSLISLYVISFVSHASAKQWMSLLSPLTDKQPAQCPQPAGGGVGVGRGGSPAVISPSTSWSQPPGTGRTSCGDVLRALSTCHAPGMCSKKSAPYYSAGQAKQLGRGG